MSQRSSRVQGVTATPKSELTRQRILDCALDFLGSNPFRKLSITTLMESTGITRPAFYHYFADLHELMEALLLELQEELQAGANDWFTAGGVGNLADALSEVVSICYRRGPILRAVVEAAPMDERLEGAWLAFVQGFDAQVAAGIANEQRSGTALQCNAQTMATVLNQMNIATFVRHFGQKPRRRKQEVVDTLLQVWLCTVYGEETWQSHCNFIDT